MSQMSQMSRVSRVSRVSRMRRRLLLIGILPSALALIFAILVFVMLDHQRTGQDRFAAGDFDKASSAFADAGSLNPFQDWVTAFDRGAAKQAAGDLDQAIDLYESALPDVPKSEECTVRINLSLAHESVGDAAAEKDDLDDARAAWTAGIKVLRDGNCPTDSGRGKKQSEQAAAVEKRLQEKLSSEKENNDSKKDDRKQKEQQKKEQKEQKKKERQLKKQNGRGEERREKKEQQREESGGYQPEW